MDLRKSWGMCSVACGARVQLSRRKLSSEIGRKNRFWHSDSNACDELGESMLETKAISNVELQFSMFSKSVPSKKLWKSFHFLANVSDDDVYRMVPTVLWTKWLWCVWDEEEDALYVVCACLEMMTRKIFLHGISEKFLLSDQCMNTCQDLFDAWGSIC